MMMKLRSPSSAAQRSGKSGLLCGILSGKPQSVNRNSVEHSLIPRSPESHSVGAQSQPASTLSPVVPIPAPTTNPYAFQPMDPVIAYYPYDFLTHASGREQLPGYYLPADGGFVVGECNAFAAPPPPLLDNSIGMFPETLGAPQPPIPPATPEKSFSSNSAFQYHPCWWQGGPHCDGLAPGRNREMGEHLRVFHHFIGHERDVVQCEWENCGQTMQRMNVPRHIVSRHLLAAASCRFCGKRFSRPDVVARHERTCNGVSPVASSSGARI